jgi:hypothetical protein
MCDPTRVSLVCIACIETVLRVPPDTIARLHYYRCCCCCCVSPPIELVDLGATSFESPLRMCQHLARACGPRRKQTSLVAVSKLAKAAVLLVTRYTGAVV